MVDRSIALEIIQVPNPCTQDWNGMAGDERVRFCGVCQKSVYNLSALPRAQAEALVAGREGRLCIRMFKREDGTVVTADCSAIRKAARRTKRTLIAAMAFIVAAVMGVLRIQPARADSCLVVPDGTSGPVRSPMNEFKGEMVAVPNPAPVMQPQQIQGKIAPPAPQGPAIKQ